jgi:hypothetical protein
MFLSSMYRPPTADTPLYKRLVSQGRIVDDNWAHYDHTHFHYLPVFEPAQMNREELCEHAAR